MTLRAARRGRHAAIATGLLTAVLVPGLAQLPATAQPASSAAAPTVPANLDLTTIGDPVDALADLDLRGSVLPTSAQRSAAGALGVVDVRWNQFGTPSSLLPADGVLARATSRRPADAARDWLRTNSEIFGLSAADMNDLELVSVQPFAQSKARAVLFRQRFDGLTPAIGSMVTVGVANGEIAYVSSSLVRDPAPAVTSGLISPRAGWLAAATDVGASLPQDDQAAIRTHESDGWTRLNVPGFSHQQQARVRALALADGTVRPVIEANVVNVAGGAASAYTVLVDAISAKVLHRESKVENNNDVTPFTGAVTATECGPQHEFELTDDATRTLAAVAVLANNVNDVTVKIFDRDGALLVTGDLGTSPELATYSAPGDETLPAGTYAAQVCPFDDPSAPFLPPGDYTLSVISSDTAVGTGGGDGPGGAQGTPRWRYFTANPDDTAPGSTPTNDVVGCWFTDGQEGCTLSTGRLRNVQAPGPWDYVTRTGTPSFTTVGNNASTHEAWASPLTPGGLFQAPYSPTQEYTGEFSDAWNNSRCSPTELVPGGNDVEYSVTNLFVSHNRMHDYSYYLGFTEKNYNLQVDNQGRGGIGGDQEIGNAQAGALSGGQPSFLGRDNANQITLQDGIPGITNQYLFQPIAGAFYAPCTDGGLDMGIVGHEYTHAISNRMVAGPDEGLTSEQGGAMGESWGDLVAAEYQFSHGYDNGGNVWAVGVYATGNPSVAIRDYAINKNPLNYSDYGFDSTGEEVHADGEIWNGTQWSVRQALVEKWDATGNPRFSSTNKRRQLLCAQATPDYSTPPSECPGNRRWVQLMFDSFLLQQGATSMLDARDAMLAADTMRFEGKDTTVMWDAFAARGMGEGASVPDADSGDTVPSFASPRARNATITLKATKPGRFYVGRYEARATPVADNLAATERGHVLRLVPGRHQMLFVSAKGGFKRFTVKVRRGQRSVRRVRVPLNLTSAAAGASVLEASPGSLNAASLIDGTEATNWGGVSETNVDQSNPYVAVDLAGGSHLVRRVQVSAMLNPAQAPAEAESDDPDSGSRFTALRQFAVEACTSQCATDVATWTRIYTSPSDAFPSQRPRPVAPDLIMRSFKVDPTPARALRLVTLENQCTGFDGYAGEQDDDPVNDTDCQTASDRGTIVHAAELQAYGG